MADTALRATDRPRRKTGLSGGLDLAFTARGVAVEKEGRRQGEDLRRAGGGSAAAISTDESGENSREFLPG